MDNEHYMRRCLQLAALGQGKVAPNPMVGAVLVYRDRIIGEGYHRQYGQAHAEVNCFENVTTEDRSLIPDATLYVSLEPCAHYGKTPPCARRIIKEGVKNVVICNKDPFDQVAGKGIQILIENNVHVTTGVLEKEGLWLNRRFFTFHEQERPYVILKWAQTEQYIFAPADRSRLQMSDAYSLRVSHQWRNHEATIMVGFTTALQDNPQLISRYGNKKQPLRIALDKDLKLPATHHLLSGEYPTWIINRHIEATNGNLHFIKLDFTGNLVAALLQCLYDAQQLSIIVEGGKQLLQSFIDQDLWDEARVFTTPALLSEGVAAPVLPGTVPLIQTQLAADKLQVYLNKEIIPVFSKNRPDLYL